jgi:hypothetical protein
MSAPSAKGTSDASCQMSHLSAGRSFPDPHRATWVAEAEALPRGLLIFHSMRLRTFTFSG